MLTSCLPHAHHQSRRRTCSPRKVIRSRASSRHLLQESAVRGRINRCTCTFSEMWDPPPTGYKLIDLTGQSPARSVPQDMMSSPVRRPVPPAHDAAASPTRDHRKMRPLRVSDSGMTAVLAIREHAAVQKQQEQHRHHQHHHQHHHSPLPEIDPSIERQTASQPQAPEGEGHATMHDRSWQP